jgi:protein ImuB
MADRRYLSLWFRHLMTDWFTRLRPALKDAPFVFAATQKSRQVITYVSALAASHGVTAGMTVSDAKVLVPNLDVNFSDTNPETLLHRIALRCIRYSPDVSIDPPDGLILNITGCTHLWGGEERYYKEITGRFLAGGYHARGAIADTAGAAWAVARFVQRPLIIPVQQHIEVLRQLPPTALRLPPTTLGRLRKLGLSKIQNILDQPRTSLTPRFGKELLLRLDQAFGNIEEYRVSVIPPLPYGERLPCLDPVVTAGGIEYALTRLLEQLCLRLQREGKGIRTALFHCYRVDGKIISLSIGTTRATYNITHLFKLFQTKIQEIEPALGIELFTLEAPKVDEAMPGQEALWGGPGGIDLAELLDRIANKTGMDALARFFPAQHHWPERSFVRVPLKKKDPTEPWPTDPRPIHVFDPPEPITVTAPVPDYPPMSFRYKDHLYKVTAANGPTRPRDYYTIEDEEGARYWVFRSGHYGDSSPARWFLHGLFA